MRHRTHNRRTGALFRCKQVGKTGDVPLPETVALRLAAHIAAYRHLGRTDPGFTLRIYTHLMPTSDGRARKAVDRAFANAGAADGLPDVTADVPDVCPAT